MNKATTCVLVLTGIVFITSCTPAVLTDKEEQKSAGERYLPRETPIPSPNALAVLSKPTAARNNAGAVSLHNTLSTQREMFSSQPGTAVLSASRARDVGDPIRVHILNIGAGSCQVVECPDSDDLLIADCGSMRPSDTDMQEEEIGAFLETIGVTGDIIVTVSHPHEDHYNRIAGLMGDRTAKSIWLGGDFNGYGGDGGSMADWVDAQIDEDVRVYSGFEEGFANRGLPVEELQCGSAETYILTVNVGNDPNTQSLVLLVEYGNFRVIFSGDATGDTEDSAAGNYGALIKDVSVLTSSHHGASSHRSNNSDWAEATSPQTVVFSSGLSHEHPRRTAGARYLQHVFDDVEGHEMWWDPNDEGTTPTFDTNQAVYSTEVNGRIIVESDGFEFSLECEKAGDMPVCF